MKYQYLNLEQKLVKVRKKIPVLLKQFHSEEVGYDFSRLDDIYELMTPALNKYGVNFDVVGEEPAMYDEAGHPVYLTLDNDGYWRYEADLILCWTNVDAPKEERKATIHAVGTHEIPDKAKGAAWTYAIKYYLRNKFCVRQDSENSDPDMRGTDSTDETQEQPINSRQEQGNPAKECEKKSAEQDVKSGKSKDNFLKTEKKSSNKTDVQDAKPLEDKKVEDQTKKEFDKQEETITKKPAEEQAKTEKTGIVNQADGFEPILDEEEIPFEDYEDDCEFMEDLNKELGKKEMEENENASAYEAARNYRCDFGLFKNKTLGDMLDAGEIGLTQLTWVATGYKGTDREMVKAARLLLASKENKSEPAAA